MKTDFTGERVVPGQVDVNLWNEHFARYAFASRYVAGRRVLDAACGTGYGSSALARVARSVVGIDLAEEAVGWASKQFSADNVRWARCSCTHLPFRNESFDVVVAFEVIEHVADWPRLIEEARRVLAPHGRFVVSTPNKSFYAKTRELEGPNPYHVHEFEFDEFRQALRAVFPRVSMFLEDHSEGVVFRGLQPSNSAEVVVEGVESDPATASFYVAVCSMEALTAHPSAFVYIPRAANMLAEKLDHIDRLEEEVRTKTTWLEEAQRDHLALLDKFRAVESDLVKSNQWAQSLNDELTQKNDRIVALQDELRQAQADAQFHIARLEGELDARGVELHASLERANTLDGILQVAQTSRWVRLGRKIGVGPELDKR
jgi:ubiquinone/menaquinone biosynthesis C-methylase UbiE